MYCSNELPHLLSVTVVINCITLVAETGYFENGYYTRQYSNANGWDAVKKAKKLPTLLED